MISSQSRVRIEGLIEQAVTGPARALCALLAALAIVSAMFVTLSGFRPMDSLFLALAVGGSACCFIVSQRNS